jgi:pyruvate dehydrogenase E2 component (dihydrolipoamide acetyltransferase)
MAELITMPKLGFDMAEGKLGEWLKKAGDTVTQGETILLVETDKASVEVPAFRSGVLLKILVAAGESVPIGTPIAAIGEAGETVEAETKAKVEVKAEAKIEAKDEAKPEIKVEDEGIVADGRLAASPVALRMAAELGIDLRQVAGSGPGGRIIKRDIEAYVQENAKKPEKKAAGAPPPMPIPSYEPTAEGYRVEPLSGMRQTIARRMVDSKQQAPHFYVTTEIDMAPAMALRGQLNALLPEAEKISVNDLIVKAAALTLRQFPGINASFAADGIHIHDHVHVGIAVAREHGLVTAVLRDCDKTSLAQLAIQTRELVARTREGRMKPDDMMGATFTISNLGMFDVEEFSAIITMPQAAALAVGAVKKIPVVNADGQLAVGTRMKVTLSADHRVTDGAEVAKFLQALKAALEQPLRLVL